MRRTFIHVPILFALVALVLSACTQPLAPLTLDPAGPVTVGVGDVVDFSAAPVPNGVTWSVDGVTGGSASTGAVSTAGAYTAPDRVPTEPTVTVTATDPVVAGRSADAEVTVTANGTLYVYDDVIDVYDDLHAVDGDVAPDRSFTIDGVGTDEYYDMIIAPALDVAFITAQTASPMIFRVPSISSASGNVTDATTFDDNGYSDPSAVAYDATRDILYVRLRGGILAFDDASTAPDGTAPDRVLTGANVGAFATEYDVRIELDVAADRLFLSDPYGDVAVYDDASTIDGDLAPDRTFTVDYADLVYLWGAAYDVGRDELYLADQRTGAAVYVMANASTATGVVAPSRVIGGPTNPLAEPSQIGYDAANDRLVVILTETGNEGFAVFDDASTVDGDVAPDRLVSGAQVALDYPYGGYLDPTQ
ncbi:MAG: hypothetical protein ABR510_12695 [Trueperaceae bacterium]